MNYEERIEAANKKAIERMQKSEIDLTGVGRASEEIAVFSDQAYTLTHSGPPVEWEHMCPAMKNSILGAIVYEGWTPDLEGAQSFAQSGRIRFVSNNDIHCVAPMSGIISPSMPVLIFKNRTYGNVTHTNLNEGLGKTLRFGAFDDSVLDRLIWMRDVLGPMLGEALELSGPVDLTEMSARGLRRGDDCHNRNTASTALFIRYMAKWLVRTGYSKEEIARALEFIDSNDHFYLNLSIGSCKATMDAASNIPDSSVVTCMTANGYSFGIKVSGCGDEWFTVPSPYAVGNYFKGYSIDDANPTVGDSYITETSGIGAFAMAAALGIGSFIGVDVERLKQLSLDMYKITIAESDHFQIPVFGYRGTPLGIDVRKIVESGDRPIINTGIAHKEPGIGQIGAGFFYTPLECFQAAYDRLLADAQA